MEKIKMDGLVETIERLSAAASALEQAVERIAEKQATFTIEAQETVERIVATIESAREAELERKLTAVQTKLAELEANHDSASGRKTLPTGKVRMLAKESVPGEGLEAATIDAALTSLNVEQRIAVKSALLRAGMLG